MKFILSPCCVDGQSTVEIQESFFIHQGRCHCSQSEHLYVCFYVFGRFEVLRFKRQYIHKAMTVHLYIIEQKLL